MTCPKCGAAMHEVATLRDPANARTYLEGTAQYAELPLFGRQRSQAP
jgi:hypothetical protein